MQRFHCLRAAVFVGILAATGFTQRKARIFEKSDERIFGDDDFVDQVLSMAGEHLERKNVLISKGYDLHLAWSQTGRVL